MMSSTLIGPELEKNDNEMEEQKFDNIEEDQASVILKKKNNEKIMHNLPPQKKIDSLQGI